ncbi:MAG: TIGR03643 family protein [Pseudomonadota bacterium]
MSDTKDPEISYIIEMAWDDETSFDAIHAQTGLLEKEVIAIMRREMKPSSFRMWRKRVTGRKSKHALKK